MRGSGSGEIDLQVFNLWTGKHRADYPDASRIPGFPRSTLPLDKLSTSFRHPMMISILAIRNCKRTINTPRGDRAGAGED